LLDVLTVVNAALLALIIILLEIFLLSRGAPPETAGGSSEVSDWSARHHGTASR
jgi:hypothetical protein